MTKAQALKLIQDGIQQVQMDQAFLVEVIDEKTGLVEETVHLPAGSYTSYKNFDSDQVGKIRTFIEDPHTNLNRLLRLAEQEQKHAESS